MTKPFIYWIRFATMVTVTTLGTNQPTLAAGPTPERKPARVTLRPSVACQEAILQGCVALMVARCWSGPHWLEPLQQGSGQLHGDRATSSAIGVADAKVSVDSGDPIQSSLTLLAVPSWLGIGISSIACVSTLVHAEFRIPAHSPHSIPLTAACCSEDHRLDLGASTQPHSLFGLSGLGAQPTLELSANPGHSLFPKPSGPSGESIQSEPLENRGQPDAEHPIAAQDGELWEVSEIPSVAPPEFHDACAQGMAPSVAWLFGTPPESVHASNVDMEPVRQQEIGHVAITHESMLATSSEPSSEPSGTSESEWATRVFRGAEYREWTDNTGTYRVHARVAVIFEDRVRLLKDTGRITTVPFTRLSSRDRAYVLWVAASLSERAHGGLQR
jgi:hypothetical protein